MAPRHVDRSNPTIYDEVDYEAMPDVSYELDERLLVQMQKLERGLHYMLDNLRNGDMALEVAAEHAGYSPGYFKTLFAQHFEIPFERFATKLRMRQAARDICDEHFPKDIAARYGYASSASFSKAFRREMGISPRQFYKGNYAVPDMPLRSSLYGAEIRLDYTVERAFLLHGKTAPPPRGVKTFLMDALALPFTGKYPQWKNEACTAGVGREVGDDEEHDEPDDHIGLWHYRAETGMEYVFGSVEERLDAISVLDAPSRENADGTLRIVVQGGRYAVFSYPRPKDDREIPLMQRMLSRYVFQEWIPMNRKETNTMGYTYERFTSRRVYLYLPIAYGMDNGSELRKLPWGVEEWALHIDELIDVDLNSGVLADLEGYSAKNYIDVFSMYYGLTPSSYIRRRRLYLAEEDLRQAAGIGSEVAAEHLDAIVRKYRFASYEQFLRMREKEFGDAAAAALSPTASGNPSNGRQIDLRAYYEFNKERVSFSIYRARSFVLLAYSIEESRERRQPQDLSERVLYWFARPFPGAERFSPYFATDGAKVFIWAENASDDPESTAKGRGSDGSVADSRQASSTAPDVFDPPATFDGEDAIVSRYYVAYVLRELSAENLSVLQGALAYSGAHLETVSGGCYAVFSSVDNLESYSLHDAFRLLTRCAFGGWIKDNRWRVDFSRRTFVAWRDSRLYFFVPIVG